MYKAKSRRGGESYRRRNVYGYNLTRAGRIASGERVEELRRTAVFMVLEGLEGPNSVGIKILAGPSSAIATGIL